MRRGAHRLHGAGSRQGDQPGPALQLGDAARRHHHRLDPGAGLDTQQPDQVGCTRHQRRCSHSVNVQQCHLHPATDSPLKARPRLRPYCASDPSDRHLPVHARDTFTSLLVGPANHERDNHDLSRRLGLSVARAAAHQLWDEELEATC